MKNKIKRTLIIATLMFLSITGFADSDCPDGLCNLQLEKLYAYKNMDPSVTQEQAGLINLAYQEFEIDPEKALQILLEKAEIEKSEAIDFSIASFYYSLENFDQSIIWYRKALEKNETFNRARANLAQVLIRIDKIDEAVKEFEKVLQTGNVSSNTYNLIGYAYMLLDKPVSAENAYRQAMLLNRNNKSALAGLARALLVQKRYNECIFAVRELLKEDPRNRDLWYILTNCYSETGQIKEAIKSLETANIISDENYSSFITLGDLYLMNEQSDYAAANYHKAFKQQGANPKDIVRAASNLFDYGNVDEAYRIIENNRKKISSNTQEEKKLKLIEAGIFINQQKLSQAEKILINLAENYPLDSSILIMNGDLYLQQKQYEKAILYYERAERTADDKSQALIRQAKVEVERENYNRAAELLENAQKLNPQPYIEKYLNQVKRFAD